MWFLLPQDFSNSLGEKAGTKKFFLKHCIDSEILACIEITKVFREIYGLFEHMKELNSHFQSWVCLNFLFWSIWHAVINHWMSLLLNLDVGVYRCVLMLFRCINIVNINLRHLQNYIHFWKMISTWASMAVVRLLIPKNHHKFCHRKTNRKIVWHLLWSPTSLTQSV